MACQADLNYGLALGRWRLPTSRLNFIQRTHTQAGWSEGYGGAAMDGFNLWQQRRTDWFQCRVLCLQGTQFQGLQMRMPSPGWI
jgi:hypothetical protein